MTSGPSPYRAPYRSNLSAGVKDDFTIDSVHRYNKKIESLNYEYNHMLAHTLDN